MFCILKWTISYFSNRSIAINTNLWIYESMYYIYILTLLQWILTHFKKCIYLDFKELSDNKVPVCERGIP